MKKLIIAGAVGILLAGCSLENQDRDEYLLSCGGGYKAGDSTVSVENLIRSMKHATGALVLYNIVYHEKVRIDPKKHSKALACNSEYNKLAEESIKNLTSKVKKKVKGVENKKLVIDAYSKWLTYMGSISPRDDEGDSQAMYDYQLSINRLKAISL